MRACPRDGTELRKERWASPQGPVDVDACSTCRGLFLDDGELKTLTGNRRLHKLLHMPTTVDMKSGITCPNCGKSMEAQIAGSVRVDACPNCLGLWLDGGELEQLRRSLSWERKLRNSVFPNLRVKMPARDSRRPMSSAELDRVMQEEAPDPKMREAALDSLFAQWMVRNWTERIRFRG